ncbi:hypothetical protein C2845_PM06G06030 [Panicum miliaceum]|uniref:DUF7769 domain-containing protein n=1 Tax=Panicum miliaceum TaxID=4540 RepID=A0A3L6RCB0_PANMI|nr:hypothetical protein C2845_PM06G06030 [Panicum miliaceum]
MESSMVDACCRGGRSISRRKETDGWGPDRGGGKFHAGSGCRTRTPVPWWSAALGETEEGLKNAGSGTTRGARAAACMATSLLDLNSAPPEQLDGELIPAEGEAAADEEGDAPTEAAGVHMATRVFLDINCTPLEELVDEIVPGGGEGIDNEEIGAMVQDEEANVTAEFAGLQQSQLRLRKWLIDSQRHAAYIALHAKSKSGKLPKTAIKEVAAFFQTQIQVIQKIWRTAREQIALGLEVDVSNK